MCSTRRNTATSLFLAALLGATANGLAQEPGPPPAEERPFRPRRDLGREMNERPDEMRETLALFFFHKVRTELALSDEQAVKLLPLVEKVEATRHESELRRREAARALERLAAAADAREEEVQAQIRALDREEERSRGEQARLRDEMLALFTPQQKARFVVFANRFRRAIEERLRNGGRGNRPGRPEGDPDAPRDGRAPASGEGGVAPGPS